MPTAPPNYTSAFAVTLPVTQTLPVTATLPTAPNVQPMQVKVDSNGITDIVPEAYKKQALPPPYQLPYLDASGARVEPLLNFGYIPLAGGIVMDRHVRRPAAETG